MNKIIPTLSILALAATAAHAQSEALALGARAFEAQAAQSLRPLAPADAFAGVGECNVLDIKTIRPWTLEEATDLAGPCLKAVAAKYSASIKLASGLISPATESRPLKLGLILMTDILPGSKAHRDMAAALERRGGRLLGHQAILLTRDEAAPASVSAVQNTLSQCLVMTVVREIRTSADFLKIYGSCLTRNADLKIDELRPAAGLVVDMKTEQDPKSVEALNGVVTVNAGTGPVTVTIVAYSAQAAMP